MLNRTDKITFSSSSNKYVDYTYDAGGNVVRKRQYDNVSGVLTLQNTTDYIDGFVYVNNTLSYFPMPEGRVLYNSGAFNQEFIITDQQGNARVSFQNNGSGTAIVKQENSYYGFGMQLANSPVTPPATPNKQLYNGGSEWQNDYTGNLPDYYQTLNRNYDAAIGRFIGVDPMAESAESITSYQYAGNDPILFNDPLGNLINPDKVLKPAYLAPYSAPGLPQGAQSDFSDAAGGSADPGLNGYLDMIGQGPDVLGTWNGNSGQPLQDFMTNFGFNNITYIGNDGAPIGSNAQNVLAPYVGRDLNFSPDGTLLSADLNPANGTAIAAKIGGSFDNPDDLLSKWALVTLLVNSTEASTANQDRNWNAINNGITAFGIGNGVKGSMLSVALNSGEEATRALTTYGKVTDAVGVAGGVVAMGSAGYNMYKQYEQNHRLSDIHIGDVGDFTVGAASVGATIFLATNPIGWAIGAGAALYFTGRLIYQETH